MDKSAGALRQALETLPLSEPWTQQRAIAWWDNEDDRAYVGPPSGETIADEYGVSRERVRQWKNAFGIVVQQYDVDPDIQKLAGLR